MAGGEDRTVLNGMEERLFKLVSKGATSAQWAEWLRVPLEHAVAEGDKYLALSLLKAGANGGAGWKGCNGRTLLDAAAEGGNEDVVYTLLDTGGLADLNAVSGDEKMTALHRASKEGHADAARVLVVTGADASLLDSRNRSALHYAIEGGHLQLAGDAIIAGADQGAQDTDGDTPLHLAAAQNDVNFIGTLLRRGASVNVANSKGQCPLHLAAEANSTPVAEALLKAGADPNARYGYTKRYSPLTLAHSSLAMTWTLLKYGADVKSSDTMGLTALHWAAKCYKAGVIDALVLAGANLEAQSYKISETYDMRKISFNGMTPLQGATFSRNFRGMATLVSKGANVNSTDREGLTPLHVVCKTCARFGSAKAADLLLRWGANETATDNKGKTPAELIEGDTDLTGRLERLLTNAPADKVWRRRGMLILCRAHNHKVLGGDREGTAGKVSRRGKGVRHGVVPLLARVVELENDSIFRIIVGFL